MDDNKFIKLAIEQAKLSLDKGGFPAGAVVVKDGKVISTGISIGNILNDPTSHAETAAIREACRILKTTDLSDAVLYGSLQPCLMCFSGANWGRIKKIVYACKKTEDMVIKGYYEGKNDITQVNNNNNKHIELVYKQDFEEDSLNIVREWEKKMGI